MHIQLLETHRLHSDRHRAKQVRLFRNNKSQAMRIPAEFELPGTRAMISRDGDRIIVEPVRDSIGLSELLSTWAPLDMEVPHIEDKPAEPRDIF